MFLVSVGNLDKKKVLGQRHRGNACHKAPSAVSADVNEEVWISAVTESADRRLLSGAMCHSTRSVPV